MPRIFAIKSTLTNDTYYGVSVSKNKKANPLKFLYEQYKKDNKSFSKLGQLIDEQGIQSFRFTFLKEFEDKEEAVIVCSKLRERPEATLNNPTVLNKNLFKNELDAIKDVTL